MATRIQVMHDSISSSVKPDIMQTSPGIKSKSRRRPRFVLQVHCLSCGISFNFRSPDLDLDPSNYTLFYSYSLKIELVEWIKINHGDKGFLKLFFSITFFGSTLFLKNNSVKFPSLALAD